METGSRHPNSIRRGLGGRRCPAPLVPIWRQLVVSARLDVEQRHDFRVLHHGEGDNAGTVFTINPAGRGSVTNLGHTPFESEDYDPAAMFAPDKILTIDKNGNAWIMDISGTTPTFTQTGSVGSNRAWSNLTVLADGTVLLTGGSRSAQRQRQCCDRDQQRRDLEPRHRSMEQRYY